MITVASLFGSQAEATAALDALAEADYSDVETRVFENLEPNPTEPDVDAIARMGSGRVVAAPDLREAVWFDGISDEAAEFFARQVGDGAVLLVARVEEERAEDLEAFLAEQGGQTAE